ncbi:MAG: peroxiredoxin [Hyphomonadaceae bacterium]|nr:peroxiredoxin [Hyphomonadaceae bacterium]
MGAALKPGDPAPDFDLPTAGGARVSLKSFKGKPLVVYFYPKDDTSGCTQEALDFTEMAAKFKAAGAAIVGVSPDAVSSHDKFAAKYGLKVQLASDPERQTIERYGVWVEKSMYGRKYMGVERATFLVGADGRLKHIWRKVKVKGHAEDVLAKVKER